MNKMTLRKCSIDLKIILNGLPDKSGAPLNLSTPHKGGLHFNQNDARDFFFTNA